MRIRNPSPPKPLPHKVGGPTPVVGPAIMAFVAANPGTNPHAVHAAIGGSFVSVKTLMSVYKMRGELHARGTKSFRVYYATPAEAGPADAPAPKRAHALGFKSGGIKNKVFAAMQAQPGGSSPSQIAATAGLTRGQVSDVLWGMSSDGHIFTIARHQIRVYFTSEALMEAARPDVMAAWAAEALMYRERKAARRRATAATHYALYGPRVCKAKPPKVVKVKAPKPPKVERAPAVPKPKAVAALVFVKTPITAAKPKSATRTGWGRDDPARITESTVYTTHTPSVWMHAPIPPARDYGPSCAEQHAQRMALIDGRRDAPVAPRRAPRVSAVACELEFAT